MFLLSKDQVKGLIGMGQVIDVVEDVYRVFSSRQVEQFDYIGICLLQGCGEIDFKLSYYQLVEMILMKVYFGGFIGNLEVYGVLNFMGMILFFDV